MKPNINIKKTNHTIKQGNKEKKHESEQENIVGLKGIRFLLYK